MPKNFICKKNTCSGILRINRKLWDRSWTPFRKGSPSNNSKTPFEEIDKIIEFGDKFSTQC